jgi:organic radical activating enzyme
MKHGQEAFIGIMREFKRMGNMPASVTFETNGTQALTQEFINYWTYEADDEIELFFSVSPKLWSVAGEAGKKAIKPEVVAQYRKLSSKGQLKFVVGSEKHQWVEMEDVISQFKAQGVDYPVWVMPVGAREEEQTATAGAVAKMAFERGYNVAARVHVYLFGNAIGT